MIACCYHRHVAQILVRQLDDAAVERLKARARASKTSVEALAREAIHKAAELTIEEKLDLVRGMQEWSRRAQVPGAPRTSGVELIREDRDLDH
jgi:plasmid stability protein